MKLGCIENGVIRTFRYFRGNQVISDKLDSVYVGVNPRGGLTFLFEIDYNNNSLTFTAAITREDENFNIKEGRNVCIERLNNFHNSPKASVPNVFFIGLDKDLPLLDQAYAFLAYAIGKGELDDNYSRTLLNRMKKYNHQNVCADDLMDDIEMALDDE